MLSLSSFGGPCNSGAHFLHQEEDAIYTTGCEKTNREALVDHLDEVTDFTNTLGGKLWR